MTYDTFFIKEVANNKFAKISNKAEIMEARSFQLDFYYTCREICTNRDLLKLALIIIYRFALKCAFW